MLAHLQLTPGSVHRARIPVARLPTDTEVSLPLAVVKGVRDGPSMWLSAAIHGDELIGVPIIHRVLQSLDATKMAGTLMAVPVVNVFGLINESRYMPDRRDLNRSFPGNKRGSLASRLAHLFMTEVVRKCDLGIDLHTGSDGRMNLPQIRCDLDDPNTRPLAEKFGAPVMVHSKERPGSLRGTAAKEGIPVLLYEAGEAKRIDPKSVSMGVDGVLRVMRALGMVTKAPKGTKSRVSRTTGWVRASRTGFCELVVEAGQRVKKGQTVAVLYDSLGTTEQAVVANRSGMVIGHLMGAVVHRGDALVHIAELQ